LVRPALKVLVGGWLAAMVLGLSGLAQLFVSRFHLTMVDTYSSTSAYESYGRTGLRLDFVAVSAVLATLTLVVIKRWPTKEGEWLGATFLGFNALYLLLGYVAFSDRLAVYSLILVPLAAWYALSTVQRTRSVALPVAAVFCAALALGVQSGQWDMLSGWW
jgi:hypothetical protein